MGPLSWLSTHPRCGNTLSVVFFFVNGPHTLFYDLIFLEPFMFCDMSELIDHITCLQHNKIIKKFGRVD